MSYAFRQVLDDHHALGEVLAELNIIAPTEIDLMRTECEEIIDPAEALQLAVCIRERLGQLLCDAERIIPEQLEEALAEQRQNGQKLGTILVHKGLLNPQQLEFALSFQARQNDATQRSAPKLGEILVASGKINRSDLTAALERQKTTGRRLGEELVAGGSAEPEDIEKGLSLQHKLVGAILALVLTALGGYPAPTRAGQQRGVIEVTATTSPAVHIGHEIRPRKIELTPQDDSAHGCAGMQNGSESTRR